MKKLFFNPIICFLLGTILLFSCKNDETLGLEIQPPSDQIEVDFSDQTSLVAYTIKDDSIVSSNVAQLVAGSLMDPIFGYSRSEFATQVRLATNNIDFGSNPAVDSIVLSLKYYTVYSDSKKNNKLTLNVYKLDESISTDSTYYSTKVPVKGDLIGSKSFIPRPSDSLYINGKKLPPMVRIRLNNSFGEELISASQNGQMISNTEFLNFLKGIVVAPNSNFNPGAMISFDNLSTYTNITFYYHNDSGSKEVAFTLGSSSARFNSFYHDYSVANTNFLTQLLGDTALGDQKLFLLPLGGTQVKIQFPGVKAWAANKKVAINKAELIIPYASDDYSSQMFSKPVILSLARNESDTANGTVEDQLYSSTTFGGRINTSGGYYSFRLTRYIQNIIDHPEEDFGLLLKVAGASVRPFRVVLNGPGATNPLKLKITYTIVN